MKNADPSSFPSLGDASPPPLPSSSRRMEHIENYHKLGGNRSRAEKGIDKSVSRNRWTSDRARFLAGSDR